MSLKAYHIFEFNKFSPKFNLISQNLFNDYMLDYHIIKSLELNYKFYHKFENKLYIVK